MCANNANHNVHTKFSTENTLAFSGEENQVKVSGAKGRPPTRDYKVCATYLDGYRLNAVFTVGGPKSVAKGRKTANAILKR